jgi:hypothetical protein
LLIEAGFPNVQWRLSYADQAYVITLVKPAEGAVSAA